MPKFGKSNVDWQQRIDFDKLRKDRLAKAHKMLHKYGIGAAIIYNWDTGRYLGAPWNHPYSKHIANHFCFLVRDAGFPYVHVREGLDAWRVKDDAPWLKDRAVGEDVITQPAVIVWRDAAEDARLFKKTAQQLKSVMKEHGVADLPVSLDYGPPPLIKALQDEGLTVVNGNAWILEADMVKFEDEIELMKMAASCNEAGYGRLLKEFRFGMRENDAQAIMTRGIYEAGAEYIEGFVFNSGPRSSPRSYNWADRTVRPGEFLSVETCHVTYCGYKVCYDRTFLAGGKPTALQSEIYKIAADLQQMVKDTLKPGMTNHDMARLRPFPHSGLNMEEALKHHSTLGASQFSNHLGGIGIRWWDAPVCNLDQPEIPLEKNMTVAYHATYTIEGYEGAAIENTYRITDTGCECLCKMPWEELIIL
ncbi:M24 family metallopeptidase [Chloroflexota bacterium]